MIPLTEERRQQIMDEERQGLWLVLREEYPQDEPTADDLLCAEPEQPSQQRQCVVANVRCNEGRDLRRKFRVQFSGRARHAERVVNA